jgi:hypothetical protein
MNKLQKRLAKLDKRVRETRPLEPQFFGWLSDPWTPEQQAEAIRRFPHGLSFWRSLVPDKDTDPVTRCKVWPKADPVE